MRDRGAELVAQADELVVDPLGGVAVAVVVDADRRHHPDLVRAGDVGDAGVAAGAVRRSLTWVEWGSWQPMQVS